MSGASVLATSTQAERIFSWMGWMKIEHVGRECDDAALLERQHGDLVMLIFIFCSFLGSFQLWTSTINNVVCIKLPQVFGVSRYISAICRGCLLVKNSFVNISEVNRQCLHSLGTRSEDDFEKVSISSPDVYFDVNCCQFDAYVRTVGGVLMKRKQFSYFAFICFTWMLAIMFYFRKTQDQRGRSCQVENLT